MLDDTVAQRGIARRVLSKPDLTSQVWQASSFDPSKRAPETSTRHSHKMSAQCQMHFKMATLTTFSEKEIRLPELGLRLKSVKQRATLSSETSVLDCPALPTVEHVCEPEPLTHSWHLPAVAVENALRFFDYDARADAYDYSFTLRPDRQTHSSFYLTLEFIRGSDGRFEVVQDLRSTFLVVSSRKSAISATFRTTWLSSKRGTSLSSEELRETADIISNKRCDLFEPLAIVIQSSLEDLLQSENVPRNTMTTACLDLLEKYDGQQQTWRPIYTDFTILDMPAARYRKRLQQYHLGQLHSKTSKHHRAVIALGSNMGNRTKYVEDSLLVMKRNGISVKSTSFLYQTKAMYYEDQNDFLNAACEVGRLRSVFSSPHR